MKKLSLIFVATCFFLLGVAGLSSAAVIDFTGGTAYLSGGGTVTPNNTLNSYWSDVDYYEENGFKLDFIGDYGIIGDYYGASNDVIHAHWSTGGIGSITSIVVSRLDSASFDLNYFILTSNTDYGGGAASGNEQTYINASNGYSQLLPSEDWGFIGGDGVNRGPGTDFTQIYLDSNFDNITWFSFTVANAVACFGMDEFYIDEPPPPPVPEPATMLLLGSGLVGLAGLRRKFRK